MKRHSDKMSGPFYSPTESVEQRQKEAIKYRQRTVYFSLYFIFFGIAAIAIGALGAFGVVHSGRPYSTPIELILGGVGTLLLGSLLWRKAHVEIQLLKSGVDPSQLLGRFGARRYNCQCGDALPWTILYSSKLRPIKCRSCDLHAYITRPILSIFTGLSLTAILLFGIPALVIIGFNTVMLLLIGFLILTVGIAILEPTQASVRHMPTSEVTRTATRHRLAGLLMILVLLILVWWFG